MAKISLITFYDDLCMGMRFLSSAARQHGHETSLIFVKCPVVIPLKEKSIREKTKFTYRSNSLHNGHVMSFGYDAEPVTDHEVGLLLDQIEKSDPDVIGLSTRSFFVDFGAPIMEKIKERFPDKLFIAGGFGPSFDPEWFLRWADYVAFGEYDSCFVNFLNTVDSKGELSECPGFISTDDDGELLRRDIVPVDTDLDELPYPDWDNDNKFLIQYDRIVPGHKFQYPEAYDIMVGRGCLGSCSYCMAWKWRDIYQTTYGQGIKKCRLRSPGNVIEELKKAKADGAHFITFVDPTLWGPREWMKELKEKYIAEIGLPFQANCHPQFTDPETLDQLIEMGLKRTCVGIQSGSQQIRSQIFNRKVSNEKVLSFCQKLDQHDVLYDFHIIGWNPFESLDDYEKALKLYLQLKSGLDTEVFQLAIFPGSMLFNIQDTLTRVDLEEEVHLYYAYLFSFVLNNEESREFAVSLHAEDKPLQDKIADFKARIDGMLISSYISGPMSKMIFPPNSPRNRLIGSGYTNTEAKAITLDFDKEYIHEVLDTLAAKMKGNEISAEEQRSFLAENFLPPNPVNE